MASPNGPWTLSRREMPLAATNFSRASKLSSMELVMLAFFVMLFRSLEGLLCARAGFWGDFGGGPVRETAVRVGRSGLQTQSLLLGWFHGDDLLLHPTRCRQAVKDPGSQTCRQGCDEQNRRYLAGTYARPGIEPTDDSGSGATGGHRHDRRAGRRFQRQILDHLPARKAAGGPIISDTHM
eukprot:1649825-Pyramimonas_sp.AAC.3